MKKDIIIYVLITARKNSKELKNKNLLKLGGISLTKRAIKNFENIKFIKKIFLSSETPKKFFMRLRKKSLKFYGQRNMLMITLGLKKLYFIF